MNRFWAVTPQPSPPTVALALLGLLVAVLLLGVTAAMLIDGELGAGTAVPGEMPLWMTAWVVLLGAFLAVILAWSVWVLSAWFGSGVAENRRFLRRQ